MYKSIKIGNDVKDEILEGMKIASEAIGRTLGPHGRLAMIEVPYSSPRYTKDGVSVSKQIVLENKFQNMGAQSIKEASSKEDNVGDGPQPLYAKVLTPNGFVRIDSLKLGDEVCRIDGTVQKVIGVYPKGKKNLYRVHFAHGEYVECCKDHLWTVTDTCSHNKVKTLTVEQMIDNVLIKSSNWNSSRYYVPNNKSFFNEREVTIDPFTLGVILGDGYISGDNVEITIGYNKVKKIIPNLILPNGITLSKYEYKDRNAVRYRFIGKSNNKSMMDFISDLGLKNKTSFTKFIPDDYIFNSFENRKKLLDGLVCTDGYINKRGLIEYSTVNKTLCDNISFLMKSMGYDIYVCCKERKIENGAFSNTPVYVIHQLKGYKYGKKIIAIEDMHKEEEMMCIKVSGEEELYITDNFITTHNTTTTAILSYAISKEGYKAYKSGVSVTSLRKGIDDAVNKTISLIKKNSKKVSSIEDIRNVAMVSSNNDEVVSNILTEAFEKIGQDGLITVDESHSGKSYLTFKEGMNFDVGYATPYFINNENGMAVLKDCCVLVTDESISNGVQIIPYLQYCAQNGKELFIIADDIKGEALNILAVNNMQGKIRVNAITSPSYGEFKKGYLEDICLLTNSTLVSKDLGMTLHTSNPSEVLGNASKVESTKNSTLIVNDNCDSSVIEKRVNELKARLENNEDDSDVTKEKLQDRIAKLCGGVCVVNVYAPTDIEMSELKDRVTDTIASIKASIKEGIVCGGGTSFIIASKEIKPSKDLTDDEIIGFNSVKKALEYPLRTLAKNADMSADVVVNETIEKANGDNGFNIYTREWDENLSSKVVDPTLVEISSLKNASSVAKSFLQTDVAIVDNVEKENK